MRRAPIAVLACAGLALLTALPAPSTPPNGLAKWNETAGYLAGAETFAGGSQRISLVIRLRATNGTRAIEFLSFKKALVRGRQARCFGKTYRGQYVSDAQGRAGSGWFGIDDQGGTAKLTITRALEIDPAPRAPPSCLLIEGRWTGTSGTLRGQSGTFTYGSPTGATQIFR